MAYACTHAGSVYQLKDGTRIPFSILGSLDHSLSVPYHPGRDLPFDCASACARDGRQPGTECPRTAHLMAMCSKLVYEASASMREH